MSDEATNTTDTSAPAPTAKPAVDLQALLKKKVKIETAKFEARGQFAPLLDFEGASLAKLTDVEIGLSRSEPPNVTFTLKWSLLDKDLGGQMIWDVPMPVEGMTTPKAGAKGKWAQPQRNQDRFWQLMTDLGMSKADISKYDGADLSYGELIDLLKKQAADNPKYIEFGPEEFNEYWSTRRGRDFIQKERYDALVTMAMHRKAIDPSIKRRNAKSGDTVSGSAATPPPVSYGTTAAGAAAPPPPAAGAVNNMFAALGRK
jgi:hypothetical protein